MFYINPVTVFVLYVKYKYVKLKWHVYHRVNKLL